MEKCLFDSLYFGLGNNLKFKIEVLNGIQIRIISTVPWWRTHRYLQRENRVYGYTFASIIKNWF